MENCNASVTIAVLLKWNASIKRWFNIYNGIYSQIENIDGDFVIPVSNMKEFIIKHTSIAQAQTVEITELKQEVMQLRATVTSMEHLQKDQCRINGIIINKLDEVLARSTNALHATSDLTELNDVEPQGEPNNSRISRQTRMTEHLHALSIPNDSTSKCFFIVLFFVQ